jgi:NADH-quinone oxidoreductase subunit E
MDHLANTEDEAMVEDIECMLRGFSHERSYLIPILQEIQGKHYYLDRSALEIGVATFYNQFRFHPPGKHQIKVCLGTACHVRGGDIIMENFERKLEIKAGETTKDREFSIDRVACVGCCALAPVAIVDETVHGHMAPSKVEGLILGFEIEKQREERKSKRNESDEQ